MIRYMAGLVSGALAAGGMYALDQRQLVFLTVVVALTTGLLTGALAGWRAPQPRVAVRAGAVAGAIAGVLLVVGDFAGGAPTTARVIGLAALSLLVCVGLGATVAGIVSAWGGYPGSARPQPRRRPEPAGATSGPLGPMPPMPSHA